jgi:hypothetical protein
VLGELRGEALTGVLVGAGVTGAPEEGALVIEEKSGR